MKAHPTHPIQLKFADKSDVVASHTLPGTVAAKAGTSQGEPLGPRVKEDIGTVLEHITDAIESEGLTLAVAPLELAILVGKVFIGSEPAEGEPYEIVIPVTLAAEKGMPEVAHPGAGKGPQTPVIQDPRLPSHTESFDASPGPSAATSETKIDGGPQDPRLPPNPNGFPGPSVASETQTRIGSEDPGMGDPRKTLDASSKDLEANEKATSSGTDPGMPDPNSPQDVRNIPITQEKPETAPSASK